MVLGLEDLVVYHYPHCGHQLLLLEVYHARVLIE